MFHDEEDNGMHQRQTASETEQHAYRRKRLMVEGNKKLTGTAFKVRMGKER